MQLFALYLNALSWVPDIMKRANSFSFFYEGLFFFLNKSQDQPTKALTKNWCLFMSRLSQGCKESQHLPRGLNTNPELLDCLC